VEQAPSPQPRTGPSLVLTDATGRHVRLADAVAVQLAELVGVDAGDLVARLDEGPADQVWSLVVSGVQVNRP